MRHDDDLRDALRERLARFERRPLPVQERGVAAVAIVATPDEAGRACLLVQRRPLDVPRHPGQFSLPGGRLEDGEDADDGARRELAEELGLALPADAVLGRLDDFGTRSGWRITPVVLWNPTVPTLEPDPREVAAVHWLAFADLAGDVVRETPSDDPDRPIVSLAIFDNRVFAPTAAMLVQFRQVCLLDEPARVAHYEQPRFAWR